jgi:delta(3,5)-delta(2,4)-dienoyl-CoA isomerase
MVHGAGIGGSGDLVGICDIQYCSRDATFMVKELDMPSPPTSVPYVGIY